MRAWQGLILVIIAAILGFGTGSRPVELAAIALLAVLILGLAYRLFFVGEVRGAREISDSIIGWGGTFSQRVTLFNDARVRIPAITVTDHTTLPDHPHGYVTTLQARRSVTWEVAVPCTSRGRYRLGPIEAQMCDPLGLFPVERTVSTASSVLVLPRWVPLRRCALRLDGFMPGEARGRRRGESPPAVAGIRDYTPGDNISAIHWQASARANQLLTKLFDPEVQTSVWLALDLDGALAGQTEELLVTIAASLSTYALSRANLRLGVVASGAMPISLPAERGRPHMYRIQEVLAEVRAGTAETLAEQLAKVDRQFGPGQVVIVLTSRGPDVWNGFLQRLLRKGVASRVVTVSEQAARWPVPSLALPPALNDVAKERALIRALEEGSLGDD